MHRNELLQLLQQHQPSDALEASMTQETLTFVQAHPNCFERTLLIGHVTGSAWIVDAAREQALLVHHQKLNRWFQPGGHCDGDADVLRVALKEAEEETGLMVKAMATSIFDVDVHLIPERKTEPAHYHYDVRFLFEADPQQPVVVSFESKDVKWIPLHEIAALNDSESIVRMVRKTQLLQG
ncbi:MAG: NUDIX hydrolase [Spirosomataceae bacterium]